MQLSHHHQTVRALLIDTLTNLQTSKPAHLCKKQLDRMRLDSSMLRAIDPGNAEGNDVLLIDLMHNKYRQYC